MLASPENLQPRQRCPGIRYVLTFEPGKGEVEAPAAREVREEVLETSRGTAHARIQAVVPAVRPA